MSRSFLLSLPQDTSSSSEAAVTPELNELICLSHCSHYFSNIPDTACLWVFFGAVHSVPMHSFPLPLLCLHLSAYLPIRGILTLHALIQRCFLQ